MRYMNEPTEFERRWLERIEQRSEWQSEWKRLKRLPIHRLLYRLGLITLGFCVALLALLAGGTILVVLLVVLHLLFVR
jgi:predicted metal-binding membrane protein